jgi:hypothetical protein
MKNTIVILLIIFTINCSAKVQPNDNTERPNVVLIIADDVSPDFSCFNGQVHTPDKKQYTKTNVMLNHDFRGRQIKEIPLEPSGLLGPVTIEEGIIQ